MRNALGYVIAGLFGIVAVMNLVTGQVGSAAMGFLIAWFAWRYIVVRPEHARV